MYAMTNGESNPLKSINYVQNEYTKFKNTFLDNINKLDLDLTDPAKCVDDIVKHMAGKKTSAFPFYYSDMLPWGTQKVLQYILLMIQVKSSLHLLHSLI